MHDGGYIAHTHRHVITAQFADSTLADTAAVDVEASLFHQRVFDHLAGDRAIQLVVASRLDPEYQFNAVNLIGSGIHLVGVGSPILIGLGAQFGQFVQVTLSCSACHPARDQPIARKTVRNLDDFSGYTVLIYVFCEDHFHGKTLPNALKAKVIRMMRGYLSANRAHHQGTIREFWGRSTSIKSDPSRFV